MNFYLLYSIDLLFLFKWFHPYDYKDIFIDIYNHYSA